MGPRPRRGTLGGARGGPAIDEPRETDRDGRTARLPRALLVLAVVAAFAFTGLRLHAKTLAPGPNDFELFHEGALRTLAGEDVYGVEGWGYPYLPTFYVLLAPLGLLPLGTAAIAWHVFKLGVLLASLGGVAVLLRRCGLGRAAPAAAIALLGVARALDSDLQLGQCNLLVLGLLVLAAWSFATHRDEVAGLAAALAALVKVTPALLLVWFAWKRRWRVVAWGGAGLLLFGAAAPGLVFGPREAVRLYGEFHRRILLPQAEGIAVETEAGYVPGQSLAPVVHRLLVPSQAVSGDAAGEGGVSIHVADVDPGAVAWIARGASLALVVLLLALSGRGDGPRGSPRTALEIGLVACVMLLASPYARKAHFVSLLLPSAACAAWGLAARSRAVLGLVAAAALLPILTSPGLLGRAASERATAYGPFGAAALLLAAASAAAILRERRARAQAPADPRLPGVSVVLPAFNEEGNVGRVVEAALAVLPGAARAHEVIVVDDGSGDGTAAVAEALEAKHPGVVRLVRHGRNLGYGSAVRSGIDAARHPVLFLTDGDGQFDLRELPGFLAPLADGSADAVLGWRRRRRDPPRRLLNAYAWGALVRTLFGVPSRDVDCAFKAMPTALLRRLDLRSEGALISTEILAKLDRAGCRMVERPVTHLPRERGAPTGARLDVILRAFAELRSLRREIARFRPDGVG